MSSEVITSSANETVKRLAALSTRAKARREEGVFVAEGERFFADTPEEVIREVYATEEYWAHASDAMRARLSAHGVRLMTQPVFSRAADTVTPQGVLCVLQTPSYSMEEMLPSPGGLPLYLFLENIQDPGNLGTLFRTAEAAGVRGIVLSDGCADLFNPKTVRATMTSLLRMPFLRTDDLCGVMARFGERGVRFYATALQCAKEYNEVDYAKPCAVLVGNEGNGLSAEAVAAADEAVFIPMQGQIESLNAAMAGGIVLFEAVRQRKYRK